MDHEWCRNHRTQIQASHLVGCFCCVNIYPAAEIKEWIVEDYDLLTEEQVEMDDAEERFGKKDPPHPSIEGCNNNSLFRHHCTVRQMLDR